MECGVCYMPFTADGTKMPQIIKACGHTFCKECLQILITTDNKNCPDCRHSFAGSPSHAFTPNFSLIRILSSHSVAPRSSSTSASTKGFFQNFKDKYANLTLKDVEQEESIIESQISKFLQLNTENQEEIRYLEAQTKLLSSIVKGISNDIAVLQEKLNKIQESKAALITFNSLSEVKSCGHVCVQGNVSEVCCKCSLIVHLCPVCC